jgi:hypothetical protein
VPVRYDVIGLVLFGKRCSVCVLQQRARLSRLSPSAVEDSPLADSLLTVEDSPLADSLLTVEVLPLTEQ